MNTVEISYDRETVLEQIQDQSHYRLPELDEKYLEEAEMLRRVYDNADTNDGACRVGEAARGLAKLHTRDDEDFHTRIYLAIVFHTLRMKRDY